MPVTTDTYRSTRRLNIVFGISALVTLVVSGWMMWHDFARPWRLIQTDFFNARSAIAHFTVQGYDSPEMKEKAEALSKAIADARAELEKPETKEKLDQLKKEQGLYEGELQGANLTYGNRNAELGVVLFNYEEAKALHGLEDPKTRKAESAFDAKLKEVADSQAAKDKLEDMVRARKDQIKAMTAGLTTAEKAQTAFNKGRQDAVTRDNLYGRGIRRALMNIPILDYAPARDTPGHQEVKQIFTKDVRINYNFADSYAVDRCMTCHISIDDPAFHATNVVEQGERALTIDEIRKPIFDENEKLVKEMHAHLAEVNLPHPEIEAPGDDSATTEDIQNRRGFIKPLVSAASNWLEGIDRPRLKLDDMVRQLSSQKKLTRGIVTDQIEIQTRRILAAGPPVGPNGKPLPFASMNKQQKEDYLESLTAALNVYLRKSGRPPIEFEKVLEAHPDLDLFVSATSPHTMNGMGCTVCHEGSGQDTDFVFAAHTPASEDEKEEWKHKYYVKELGVPLATFHLVEEFWERPMLQAEYTSASCVKCHTQIYDIERHKTEKLATAENIVEGRDLFTKVGCINCHNVEGLSESRRVGPDLAHVGDKLSTGFMERWIEYPNNFRPSTRMPHFFKQENNLDPSRNDEYDPAPELRTSVEIKAMVRYLETFSKPFNAYPLPEGIEGDAKHGEELFASVGCLACHVNLDAKDPLDQAGRTFAEKWIVEDLTHDLAAAKTQEAQRLGRDVTPELIAKMVEETRPAALEEFNKMSKNAKARYASDKFTVDAREAAHAAKHREQMNGREPDALVAYVPPMFTRQGPELSGLGTKLVPTADDAEQVKQAKSWLYTWLREPRHYSSYTIMPRLFEERYYTDLPPDQRARKRDQDVMDLAAYLISLRNDEFDGSALPTSPESDVMLSNLILDLLGGQNTESVAKQIAEDQKADASEPYGPLSRAIVNQAYRSFGGGDEGKRRVASILQAGTKNLRDRQEVYLGMKMISHYGCYACHNIAGFEDATRPGTDLTLWGQKFITQLDFGFYAPIFEEERAEQPKVFGHLLMDGPEYEHLIRDSGGNPDADVLHNHASFAYTKMRNPRIWDRAKYKKPYDKLKMPNFYFTDAESRALTTYLLSRKDPLVTDKVKINYKDTDVGRIARGRALVRELNCIGCHTIEGGAEANIHQYYTEDTSVDENYPFGSRFKPPLLWGEGAKIQYNWLFRFLNNVEELRPWLNVRMPSFHLTTEDASAIVEYFAGLSHDESEMLKHELAPIVKYIQEAHGSQMDGEPASNNSAGSLWFTDERFAESANFLRDYAIRHKQSTPFEFDTSSYATASEANEGIAPAYAKVIKRTSFLSNVFDVPFPFVDPHVHAAGDPRFKQGEQFFYELKCLACHVAGDPSVPGTTQIIKAPNFGLTGNRLRYDWVVNWLQDPQAIQPGANMPQIFQGGSAFASLPEESRKGMEDKFGHTVPEQSPLLVDFLFSIADRKYTAVQPGAAEEQARAATQPAEQFDFDSGGEKKDEKQAEPEFDF